MRLVAIALAVLFSSCGGIPGPQPPDPPVPEPKVPPVEEQCHLMTPPAQALCYDNPANGQSFPEWDPNWGYVCALPEGGTSRVGVPADCPVAPPLPQPQCETFINRGGMVSTQSTACGCYIGHEPQPPCEPEPPPQEGCGFPIIDEDNITPAANPGTMGSIVNKAMAEITGCFVGQEPCPISVPEDVWFTAVCEEIRSMGFCCGRHIDVPPGQVVCPPGRKCTDQISVKATDFCDGKPHENYRVINPSQDGVRWFPSASLDGWFIECIDQPPPVEPPTGDCPQPHPDLTSMTFNTHEEGNHMDTTWVTKGQPEYCGSIGYCCMPHSGTNDCDDPACVPRGGCPVRGDGDPERPICEAELCDQKWECNGVPVEGWNGNPAQTDCRGHWKTWCSAPDSTAIAEGTR